MRDVFNEFETAACGYLDRLDTLDPTEAFKHMLDKLENRRADEGTFLFSSVLVTTHDA